MCDIFIMCFVLFLFVACFGWNFNVIAAVAAAAEVGEGGGEGGGRRRRRRKRRSLGVIMTNTEIFHIFHIFSLFNLLFLHISISFHYSTWLSSISSIYLFTFQLSFLQYFPYHFTIQLTFLPYFSYLFTIQLAFLPY